MLGQIHRQYLETRKPLFRSAMSGEGGRLAVRQNILSINKILHYVKRPTMVSRGHDRYVATI